MGGKTSIEWTQGEDGTQGHTWNPVVGCQKVSPGCAACYAEVMAIRLKAMALAKITKGENPGRLRHYIDAIGDNGKWSGKLVPVPEALSDPFSWKKRAMVFVNSMSDLFHKDVIWDFIDDVFAVMWAGQWHTFQVLTKRPERMAEYLASSAVRNRIAHKAWWRLHRESAHKARVVTVEDIRQDIEDGWPLPNVWLGTSVEDQKRAEERLYHLLDCPSAVRFLSIEPMLGPLDISPWLFSTDGFVSSRSRGPIHRDDGGLAVDWVIVGCESGPKRRPMKQEWAESLLDQCEAAGVAFFMKQMEIDGKVTGDIEKFPKRLRVRQFPEAFNKATSK